MHQRPRARDGATSEQRCLAKPGRSEGPSRDLRGIPSTQNEPSNPRGQFLFSLFIQLYPSDLGYRRASNSALFSPPGGAGSCWTSAGLVHRRSGGVGPRRGLPGPPAGPRGRYDTKLPPLGEPSRDPRGPSRDKSGDVSLEPSNPRTDQDSGLRSSRMTRRYPIWCQNNFALSLDLGGGHPLPMTRRTRPFAPLPARRFGHCAFGAA